MKIVYYPQELIEPASEKLSKYIWYGLRKLYPKQWTEMFHFLNRMQHFQNEKELIEAINNERPKQWKKRQIAKLGNGLYEFRGKQSKIGTIRMYFCFDENQIYILDAEFKTDDKNNITRAKKRMEEYKK